MGHRHACASLRERLEGPWSPIFFSFFLLGARRRRASGGLGRGVGWRRRSVFKKVSAHADGACRRRIPTAHADGATRRGGIEVGGVDRPTATWLHIGSISGSISASPTACPLRGYGRAGTQNDRLSGWSRYNVVRNRRGRPSDRSRCDASLRHLQIDAGPRRSPSARPEILKKKLRIVEVSARRAFRHLQIGPSRRHASPACADMSSTV